MKVAQRGLFYVSCSGPCAEIDMRSGDIEGYDAVFLSPHKFVGGPGTPGILLMSKALYHLGSSPPSTCGGGTVCYVNSFSNKVIPRCTIISVKLSLECRVRLNDLFI